MSEHRPPAVSRRVAGGLGVAWLLIAALTGCARPGPLGGFVAPRTVRLAPDGRLLVTDQGTGNGDGKVVAVDLATRQRTVLLADLPSTRGSGQQHADLAGPSGAAMAADGTVCAAIGDATRERAGFSTLRCSNGLVADLEAFERAANPDGRELASNPYDVVWDGRDGWYVSDAAANAVLHVDRAGRIRTVAVVASMAPFGGRPVQGVPTGLARATDGTVYVALFGGAPAQGGAAAVVALRPGLDGRRRTAPQLAALAAAPIGVVPTPEGLAVLDYGGGPADRGRGRILLVVGPADAGRVLAAGMDRPVGMARLPDGRYVVAETDRSRLRVLTSEKARTSGPEAISHYLVQPNGGGPG
jgi:DNA-binding beta-propeller fold protein YncE